MRQSSIGTVYLLKRAELAVRMCMDVVLADFDLTPAQFLLLFQLRDRHDQSAAALAREIGVRPQSIGEIIGPLERKKLLQRDASLDHQRILHTQLTPAGRKLLAKALDVAARIEAELLSNLADDEIAALQDGLTALWRRAATLAATSEKAEALNRRAAGTESRLSRAARRPRAPAPASVERPAARPPRNASR
jgi:DNA-binding MarR family transcriptional regulator